MDPIKEAFSKIKLEIEELKTEIINLKDNIKILQQTDTFSNKQTHSPTISTHNMANNNIFSNKQTHSPTISTHNMAVEIPYTSNFDSSIGNKGVPTNKPTDTQTNQQTQNNDILPINNEFKEVNNILESLDNAKKGIRLKFKRLTTQEMAVFSHLYELQEQKYDEITYKAISKRMNLSESSIRDYINRLIKKGIPIEKLRQNNKIIILKISDDLKNIANLSTIQSLRSI